MRADFNPEGFDRNCPFGRIVQLAFHAPDIRREAEYWSNTYGAGPFFLIERIPLKSCLVHGKEAPFVHSSAYGQCGDLMIELIHQHGEEASPLRDFFDADTYGLHHAAVFVEDLEVAIKKAQAQQMECALDATTKDGNVRFLMFDARPSRDYMFEFYERTPSLEKFYTFVRRQSENWDGKYVLRKIGD